MNDEHEPRHGDAAADGRPPSRWVVNPGSVTDSFGSRPDDEPGAPRRRSARDIIDEVRGSTPFRDDYPTQISSRRPSVPEEPVHHVDPEPEPAEDPRRSRGRREWAERDDRDNRDDRIVQRAARAPLYDESTRVKPELGEKRELRPMTPGATSGMVMAGFGGVILIVIGTLIGAIIDYLFTDRLGLLTTVGITVAAAVAALITRKRDLVSVIVAPPLIYAAIAFIVLLLSGKGFRLTAIADLAIRGFPAMALATAVAAIIGGVRLFGSKVGDRP